MTSNSHSGCAGGCSEYLDLSRRSFLRLAGGALGAFAAQSWMPRVVLADSHSSTRDVLVSIFLPGGCDGLSMIVPYEEDNYYTLRPTLAIRRPGSGGEAALDLDGFFGLAPALAPLMEAYSAGNFLAVHATGSKDPTRSHFDAMHFMQVGVPQPPASLFTGWLARHLLTSAPTLSEGVLRAVSMGYGVQRTLTGAPSTIPLSDIGDFELYGREETAAARRNVLAELYAAGPEPMRSAAANTQRTIDLLASIDFDDYAPAGGISYPNNEIGYGMRAAAALIRAEIGVEAIGIDYGGWDTHESQGPVGGQMAQQMSGLGQALAAFHEDVFGSGCKNVVVVTMSEFGRNVAENGTRGTDHGHGNVMFVLGDHVNGGRVLTEWPGLAPGQLYEGQDLQTTIDYRDIVGEIVMRRLGNNRIAEVFPDSSYAFTERGATVL
jgi:uncharacterized protein (DUF1501 family)